MTGPFALLLVAALSGEPRGQLEARFHHLHLTVADPAAAMRLASEGASGTSVILQGLGVGVRVGERYFLFERGRDEPITPAAEIARRYRAAVRWLADSGARVDPQELEPDVLEAQGVSGVLDHVGFAVPNLDTAVEAFGARGIVPIRRTADAATFAMADGQRLEIVRDTDRPDTYWCPMHADVRSPAAGKCGRCGMDLVPIPPSRHGAYHLDLGIVTAVASHAPPGTLPQFAGLELRVLDPEGALVRRFVTVHEHPLHLFVISRDLKYFRHLHPDDLSATADLFDGTFEIPSSELAGIPPGPYVAIADVLPYGGASQMLHRAFVTPRYKGPVFAPPPALQSGPSEVVVDNVRVRVDPTLQARKTGSLRFTFLDAATGVPLTDLEPFLSAPAHLLIVSADLTHAIHAHPGVKDAGGPTVSFEPLIPAPGGYKMWVQFQRRGKVSTASFVVRVN
jgi:hypothetical protein